MKRGGPLNQRSAKRVAEDREREKAKTVVRQRARGGCEAQGVFARNYPEVGGCAGPFDFHEVLTRARGGSITDPENILMVCRRHHDWLTDHPVEAAVVGLVRNSWEAPAVRPVPRPTPRTGLQAVNVRPLPVKRVVERTAHPSVPAGELVTVEFAHPERPWTVNGERKMTHFARAEKVKLWREAWKVLAVGAPHLAWATVRVNVYLRDLRDQDPGGAFPAYKAAMDGLVDGGVLPDDDGRYVHSVTFYPPAKKTYDALELILTGDPRD